MQLAKRGAAMLAALLLLVVASGIITLMFTSTLSEIRHTGDDVAIVQALALARGGVNLGGKLLQEAVRDELQTLTLREASTVERFPFGSSPNITDPEPSPDTVIRDLVQKVTTPLQGKIDALVCSAQVRPENAQLVSVKIYVTDTACGDPLSNISKIELPAPRFISGQTRTYAIPFVLVAEAQIGSSYKRNIATQGEYQFTIGGGKFSQYALFTDVHLGKNNGDVWFTNNTGYDGRVHTNGSFKIAYEPWFGDKATSVGCTSRFETVGSDGKRTTECRTVNTGAEFASVGFKRANQIGDPPQFNDDKPEFTQGVDWRSDYIPLPVDALEQEEAADENGLPIAGDQDSVTLYAGDAAGNKLVSDGNGGWTPQASHQYIEHCTANEPCQRYRYSDDFRLYKQNPDGTWPQSSEPPEVENFNGLVYIDGEVERLRGPDRAPIDSSYTADAPPALASFAKMTIVPKKGARITGDLKYESPPCSTMSRREGRTVTSAICDNLNTKNILGVFAPTGDILVGSSNSDLSLNAPHDVEIHGSFMASEGVFGTENYWRDKRGEINLLGGIIEKKYGATGQFGRNGVHTRGYAINVTFDQRMALDYSPPVFPGTGPSDIQGVFVYIFGQREQAF